MKLIKLVLIKALILGFYIHDAKAQKVNNQSIEISKLDAYSSHKKEIDEKNDTRLNYIEKVKVTF